MDTAFIQRTIEDVLGAMGISGTVDLVEDADTNMAVFNVSTQDSKVLIGHKGEHLNAFSHIIKKIADRHAGSGDDKANRPYFLVDINNYQRRHIDEIKGKATILAERARYFKSSVEMDPMSAYDRMIVHSMFANKKDIRTESDGQGKNRHIVFHYEDDPGLGL